MGSLNRQWMNRCSALELSLPGRGRQQERPVSPDPSLWAVHVALAADLSGKYFFVLLELDYFWGRGCKCRSWKPRGAERSVPAPGLHQAQQGLARGALAVWMSWAPGHAEKMLNLKTSCLGRNIVEKSTHIQISASSDTQLLLLFCSVFGPSATDADLS